ncbi:Regulatory protein BlaR1 [Posidoniimonas corsicana]|uniref:Regulatory protein BlaR1 n=1 Tax=Posidoniimonas corsicana TaxID=1938618 RepID=A0A5C5V9B1_9BACT|nr:M56 family metallopeptidase [Posidoniimonas corsicana]TWT35164.1 Regulatory protein BlaR1 [Posidoniimonas corsicana]
MIAGLLQMLSSVGLVIAPDVLVDTLAKATLLLLLALLSCAALRRASAASKHYLLGLTVGSLCLLPLLSAFGPQLQVLPASWTLALHAQLPLTASAPSNASESGFKSRSVSPIDEAGSPVPLTGEHSPTADLPLVMDRPANATEAGILASAATTADANDESARTWLPVAWQSFAVLWLLGCMTLLARLAAAMVRLRKAAVQAAALEEPSWLSLTEELATGLGMSRRVWLVKSGQAAMPMTWGVWRPHILLPADCDAWSPERKRVVLLHELAHIQRRDSGWLMLTELVRAVYWVHPLVWVAARQMTAYREQACDDRVLNAGHTPTDYAEHLLHIATQSAGAMPPCAAAIGMARASELEGRVRLILDSARNRSALSRALAGGLALLLAAVAFPLAILHAAEQSGPAAPNESAAPAFARELQGGKIELLAIGAPKSDPPQWWAPDGTPLVNVSWTLQGVDDRRRSDHESISRAFVYRATNINGATAGFGITPVRRFLGVIVAGENGEPSEAYQAVVADLDKSQKAATFFFTADEEQVAFEGLPLEPNENVPPVEPPEGRPGGSMAPQLIGDRYLVCPVTTELQRVLLGNLGGAPSRASVCLLVNAASFGSLDDIHDQSEGMDELRAILPKLLVPSDSRETSVRLIDPGDADFTFDQRRQRMQKLERLLTDTCQQAGFEPVRVTHTFGVDRRPGEDFQWSRYVQEAQQATLDRDASQENIVELGVLRVASVHTLLAYRLSGADCIVDVAPIVRDADGARFVEDVLPMVKSAIEKLHPAGGDKLLIRLRYSKTAKEEIEQWVQWDNPRKKQFGQELSFERVSVSQSGIAPSEEDEAGPAEGRPEEYEYPLSVAGRATNEQGEPIPGAKIYLAACTPGYKRLAETITDERGDYRFENVPLPIKRADTNRGRDSGGFEVFGVADGYALSWRPTKYLDPTRAVVDDTSPSKPPGDRKTIYGREEGVSLDLTFGKPTSFRGRIVNDLGEPLPDAEVTIRGVDWERKQWNRDRSAYNLIQGSGLNSLNGRAIVPTEVKARVSDEDGYFEFTGLPANVRWDLDVRPKGVSPRRITVVTGEPNFEMLDVLKSYGGDFELVFPRPRQVTFRVVYSDTGQPAQGVGVGATVTQAGFWETTAENGLVTAPLADGSYDLGIFPRFGTPYLKAERQVLVSEESVRKPIEIEMDPAAVVEILVLDESTGEPLEGVDVWWEEKRHDGRPYRQVRGYRSWEVETRISHYERPRTDTDGKVRVLFPPGDLRIGVGLRAYPEGYRSGEENGRTITCRPGEPTRAVYKLKSTSPRPPSERGGDSP